MDVRLANKWDMVRIDYPQNFSSQKSIEIKKKTWVFDKFILSNISFIQPKVLVSSTNDV